MSSNQFYWQGVSKPRLILFLASPLTRYRTWIFPHSRTRQIAMDFEKASIPNRNESQKPGKSAIKQNVSDRVRFSPQLHDHLPKKNHQSSYNTAQGPTTVGSWACSSQDCDDKQCKPEDSIDNIQYHVRFCACPSFQSVHMSRQDLVGHENCWLETLQVMLVTMILVKTRGEVAYNGDAPDVHPWFRGTIVCNTCDDQDEHEQEQGADNYV